MINSENRRNSLEEIYDLKENMWLNQKITPSRQSSLEEHLKVQEFGNPEVLIKSMLLLIKCQKQMPGKWIRFNDKRLREIVFAFIHLLSSTTNLEVKYLSLK